MLILQNAVLLADIYLVCLIASVIAAAAFLVIKNIRRSSTLKALHTDDTVISAGEMLKLPDKKVKKPIMPQAFTLSGVFGFFFAFGLSGLLLLRDELAVNAVFILSLLFGIAGEVSVSMLAYALAIKNDASVIFAPQSVGLTGVVSQNIPASKKGTGYIRVFMNGRVVRIKALSVDEVSLTKGTEVNVMYAYSDSSVVVEMAKK